MSDDGLLKKIGLLGNGSFIIVNTCPSLEGAHMGILKQRGNSGPVWNRRDRLVLRAPLYMLKRLQLRDGTRSVEVPNLVLVYTSLEDATRGEYADWTMAVERVRFLAAGFEEIHDALLKDDFYAPLARYFRD